MLFVYCNRHEIKFILSYLILSYLILSYNGHDGVSNHQPHDCLLSRLFRRRWKKTSKLRVTGLCEWNSPVVGEFPAQMASNVENVSIWWRHHVYQQNGYLALLYTFTWNSCPVDSRRTTRSLGNIIQHQTSSSNGDSKRMLPLSVRDVLLYCNSMLIKHMQCMLSLLFTYHQ